MVPGAPPVSTDEDLAAVQATLAGQPHLAETLDASLKRLHMERVTVAVGGSLGRGVVDDHSDLDLVLVAASPVAVHALQEQYLGWLIDRFEVIVLFDAAHIQLPSLLSIFLAVRSRIVKLDACFWSATDGPPPVGGVVVADSLGAAGLFADIEEPGGHELARAPHDIVGWSWYIRTRILRGELWEAGHALDSVRRRMLVPVLLALEERPQVNYRRLEQRLDARTLQALERTYPAAIRADELWRALVALTAQFLDRYEQLAGHEAASDVARRLSRTLGVDPRGSTTPELTMQV